MFKNRITKVIFVIPHITLGDNVILYALTERLVERYPELQFTFLIHYKFISLYRETRSIGKRKVIRTFLNPWKFNRNSKLGESWRRIVLGGILIRVVLETFPRFTRTLVLGPDWMTSPYDELDLFDSPYTRLISSNYVPSIQIRNSLRLSRSHLNMGHRQNILNQLQAIGFQVFECNEPLFRFPTPSSSTTYFLEELRTAPNEFILCFLGAGNLSRDWTTVNEDFLRKLANDNYCEIVFVNDAIRTKLGSLVNLFELISLARVVISNDTGWAHCAIEMKKPLICISTIGDERLDSYIRTSHDVDVIRPEKLLGNCSKKCTENYYHCVSTISIRKLAGVFQAALKRI